MCCSASLLGVRFADKGYSDEHQRRSPDCMLFTFSAIKPKAGRTKKGRASATSRLSTQSNFTNISEAASIAETEGNLDESMTSSAETARPATSAKGGRKGPKSRKASGIAKGKAGKAKQQESQIASSFLEPEDDDFEVKVVPALAAKTKGRKRKSEEMSADAEDMTQTPVEEKAVEPQPLAKKRRATRARGSVAQPQELPTTRTHEEVEDEVDTHMTDAEEMPPPIESALKKKEKSGKNEATSIARKFSTASTASKASLRAVGRDDEEIDAALEADLNRPLTDEEGDTDPLETEQPKSRRLTRSKPSSKKATASVASTRRGTRASTVTVEDMPMTDLCSSIPHVSASEQEQMEPKIVQTPPSEDHTEPLPKAKNAKSKALRKVSKRQQNRGQQIVEPVDAPAHQHAAEVAEPQQPRIRQVSPQLPARRTRTSNVPIAQDVVDLASDINSSVLGTRTIQDDSGHETDASVMKQGRAKRAGKKAPSGVNKTKGAKKSAMASRNFEDTVQAAPAEREADENDDQPSAVVLSHGDSVQHGLTDVEIPQEQPKVKKASTKGRPKKLAPKAKTTAKKAQKASSPAQPSNDAEVRDRPAVSSPPSVHSTPRPAISPQSSDAENQPPSSRPSALRPPLSMQSPSRSQSIRVPLAVTTPTASPSRGSLSKLQSTFPWTAIDLEQIFRGSPSPDKENNPFVHGKASGKAEGALTSPEKKLSVEQWIQFNAERYEEKLRNECERLVGIFESQGMRASKTLEGIVAAE